MSICPLALPPEGRCAALRQNLPAVAKTLLISSVVCALLTAVAWQLGFASGSLATSLFIGEGVLFMGGLLSLALSCPKKVHKIPAKKQLDKTVEDSMASPDPVKPQEDKQLPKAKKQNRTSLSRKETPPAGFPSVERQNIGDQMRAPQPLETSQQNQLNQGVDEQKLESPLAPPELTKEKRLERSLDSWIWQTTDLRAEEALLEQKRRKEAKDKILNCFNNQYKQLSLCGINIQQILPLIFEFNWLNELWLSDCKISDIPEEIGNFTNLTELYIQQNNIQRLPASFNKLTQLTSLDISKNKLDHVPEQVFASTKLERLDLSFNRIQEIPAFIGGLKKLTYLALDHTEIKKLPEELGNCEEIEYLKVMDTSIQELPKSIGRLTKLKLLWVSKAQLTSVPEELTACKNLEDLDLAFNPIEKLEIDLTQLPKLTSLKLYDTKLSSLPNGLEACQKLSLPRNLKLHVPSLKDKYPKLETLNGVPTRGSSLSMHEYY